MRAPLLFRRAILAGVLLIAGALGACSSKASTTGGDQDNPSFTLTVGTSALSVAQSASGTVNVTIARAGGFVGAVTLSVDGLPTGVSVPTVTIPAGSTTGQLVFTANATATVGGSAPTITATGQSVTGRTATLALTVTQTVVDPGTFTLTATPIAVSALPGANATATIQITRGGGFTQAVALTATTPAGITATFAPTSTTGNESTLTLAVGAGVALGDYTVTVRGNATGLTERTTTLTLSVTAAPSFTMAVNPATITVQAGQQGSATADLVRSGGFAGAVAITATAPAGLTVTPNPTSVVAAQSTLTVAVAGGTAAGNYTVTVRGNATGQTERTATLTVTVTAAPSGGSGNTTWTFCPTFGVPLWFAKQDGSGAWTRVTASGNAYAFDINAAKGGVAYVLTEGAGTGLYVFYGTQAELQARGGQLCASGTGATKTVNATAAGLPLLSQALLSLGSALATVTAPTTAVQWTNVQPGSMDLIAGLSTITIGGSGATFTPSRMFLRRGVTPTDGGNLGTIDFNGAESFAPATATLTLANSNAEYTAILESYVTNNNTFGTYFIDAGATGTSRTITGVPGAKQVAGDLHFINVSAVPTLDPSNTATRNVGLLFATLGNKTMTFGPALTIPTVSTLATAPYARVQASYAVQAEYNRYFTGDFQQTSNNRHSQIQMTSGWLAGAANAQLAVPDLSAVTGWNNAWGLATGVSTHWTVTATGWSGAGGIISTPYVEGATYLSGTKQGDITP